MANKGFHIGDVVGVLLGGLIVRAIIVEDRGKLGPGDSRIVRVETEGSQDGSGDVRVTAQFEVPETALVAV